MKTKVFFNNCCNLCKKEISIYKKFSKKNLVFIKIFDDEKSNNIPVEIRKKFLRRLHVTSNGRTFVGAEAFLEIWKQIPKFRFLYKVFKIKPLFLIIKILYEIVSFFLFLKNYHLIRKK